MATTHDVPYLRSRLYAAEDNMIELHDAAQDASLAPKSLREGSAEQADAIWAAAMAWKAAANAVEDLTHARLAYQRAMDAPAPA